MHRPIPAASPGSLADDGLAEDVTVNASRRLDHAFSLAAILAASTVWAASYACGLTTQTDVLVKESALIILSICLPGLWLMHQLAAQPQATAAKIYTSVLERVSQDPAPMRVDPGWETPFAGIARLIGDLTIKLRDRTAKPTPHRTAERAAQTAAHTEAARLASTLREDSESLTRHITAISDASAALAGEIAATRTAAARTENTITIMTERAVGLAGAVRATTMHAERAAGLAVEMSETAFAVQSNIAALDDKTAAITLSATTMGGVLQRAQTSAGHTPDFIAEIARAAQHGLADLQNQVRDLTQEAAAASARLQEMSVMIQAQHTLGQAVCHAVLQQGEEVSAVLDRLHEAREGFISLRAGVDAVSRTGRAAASQIQNTAARLPSHAETVAGLLRNINDFAPPGY